MKISYFSPFVVPVIFLTGNGVSPTEGFASSCYDISLSGSTLSAERANGSGGTKYTEPGLDKCLADNFRGLKCTNFCEYRSSHCSGAAKVYDSTLGPLATLPSYYSLPTVLYSRSLVSRLILSFLATQCIARDLYWGRQCLGALFLLLLGILYLHQGPKVSNKCKEDSITRLLCVENLRKWRVIKDRILNPSTLLHDFLRLSGIKNYIKEDFDRVF